MVKFKSFGIGTESMKTISRDIKVRSGPVLKEAEEYLFNKAKEYAFEKGLKALPKIETYAKQKGSKLVAKGHSKLSNDKASSRKVRKNKSFGYSMKRLNKLYQDNKISENLFEYLSDQILHYDDVLAYDCKTFETFFDQLIEYKDIDQEIIRKYEVTRDKNLKFLRKDADGERI